VSDIRTHDPVLRIAEEMREAAAARKCWPCGCFQDALAQLSDSLPSLPHPDREHLTPALRKGTDRVLPRKYDCLGCDTCWPANGLNVAAEAYPEVVAGDACPTDTPTRGQTWPPLPGEYQVLDAGGHIAVCVLTSTSLMDALMAARPPQVAIVGTLHTENLGIERVITNVMANPNLLTLLVCGTDSQQRIGHRPGQSLLSLMTHGVDEGGRIRGAKGRRPVLRNLPSETVETFRREVTAVDQLGEESAETILEALATVPFPNESRGPRVSAPDEPDAVAPEPPPHLVLDPKGYFVLFPDRIRKVILVEHYENDGTLARAFTGRTAHELYATIIARELVSRLDHAAYLGSELARAERSLETGEPYVQDRAPEPPCHEGCGGGA
jgi:tetrahydromethanopterin S-methyltransferase subunit A